MAISATLPTIRPISDLRTKLNDIEAVAKETQEPIIMTKNGAPSLVVMDSNAFDEMMRRERAVLKLREAEIEAKYTSRTYTRAEVMDSLQDIFDAARDYNA